jgi:hypothetical protein
MPAAVAASLRTSTGVTATALFSCVNVVVVVGLMMAVVDTTSRLAPNLFLQRTHHTTLGHTTRMAVATDASTHPQRTDACTSPRRRPVGTRGWGTLLLLWGSSAGRAASC